MRDYSGGCRQNVVLDCAGGNVATAMTIAADGFLRLRGVKLPDAHNVSVDASVTTLEECGARCMANCSYVAYAPMDIRGGGGVGSGCIMWTVRMKTVGNGRKTPQPFSTFIFEYENGSENGKAGHENERELMEYREFRK
jgi:hypothetical protein